MVPTSAINTSCVSTEILMQAQIVVYMMLTAPLFLAKDERPKTMRYVRPAGSEYSVETEITLKRSSEGHSISSVTHRGQTHLSLASVFDAGGHLQSAIVTIVSDGSQQTTKADIAGRMVTVTRSNGRMDELDCPSGIIVTSAPDWTDTFMLMSRYDDKKGEEQRFDGLWIHPTLRPLRLSFTVKYEGTDAIEFKGKTQPLERFSIVLRNESRYVAWRNGQRELVRLVANGQEQPTIVFEGWEQATVLLIPRSH